MRFILATTVLVGHCGMFAFMGPAIAVQTFYILSGFYMTLILREKYPASDWRGYWLFISNRFLKLFPAYWSVLFLTGFVSIAFWVATGKSLGLTEWTKHFSSLATSSIGYLILSNLLIVGQDIIMFLKLSEADGTFAFTTDFRLSSPPVFTFLLVPQAWSLALELTFYAIAPFVVRRNLAVIAAIIAFSLTLRFVAYRGLGLAFDPWTYRFFPFEVAWFLSGTVSYYLYRVVRNRDIPRSILLVAFALMILCSVFFQFLPRIRTYAFYPFMVLSIPLVFRLTKDSKFDNWIGDLSYPMYISHVLVIGMILALFKVSNHVLALGTMGGTIALSIALNKFVLPIEQYRQRRSQAG